MQKSLFETKRGLMHFSQHCSNAVLAAAIFGMGTVLN